MIGRGGSVIGWGKGEGVKCHVLVMARGVLLALYLLLPLFLLSARAEKEVNTMEERTEFPGKVKCLLREVSK